MEKSFININDTEQELVITLSRSEVEPAVNEAYKELAPKVHLDGFRPGRVPMHLIKKMYGNQIEDEQHHKLVDKYFKEFVDETNVAIVSQPELTNIEKKDGGIEFKLRYEYIPEFQITDYKNIVADEPVHRVTEEEVAQNLEMISYTRGTLESAEIVEDKNFIVSIVVKELYDAHFELEDAKIEDLPADKIYLRRKGIIPEFLEALLGKKVGESFEWSNPDDNHNHADHDHDHKHTSTLIITKIERVVPIEFTEENIAKISDNKFNNFEDYKLALELEIQKDWDNKSNDILVDNIVKYLLENNDIKVPQSYILERAKEMILERAKQIKNDRLTFDTLSDKDKSYQLDIAEKVIKFSLIREAIIKAEGIEVEEYDIDNKVQTLLDSMPSENSAYFEQFKEIIKKDQNIINQILGEKVMDLLKDFTTTNEVAFPADDLGFEEDFFEEDDDENEDFDIFDGDEEILDDEFEEEEEFEDDDDWDDDDEEDFEDDDEEWEEDDEEWDDDDEEDDDEEDASKNQ